VGELARQTGLSVRTLHHYDEIGLLSPSLRTPAGHRLYALPDIARLQQIVSLRQIGLSLEEIAGTLKRADISPLRIVELQLDRLRHEIDRRQNLARRLESVANRLRTKDDLSIADLTQLIEVIQMFEKHYTPEQLEELAERRRQLGDAHIQEVESEWPHLIAQVRAEMDRGSDPATEPMQTLAARWQCLIQQFTGGNPQIAANLRTAYTQEPQSAQQFGLDPTLLNYVQRALAAKKPAAS
jgi:DNA-binding transcriptional MerR regulator